MLYKFLLTLSATSWMPVIYIIANPCSFYNFLGLPRWASGLLMLLAPILLSLLALAISPLLESETLSGCEEISLADQEFIPIYLGYFFVSLSVPDNMTMLFVYGIIFVFTWLSQTQCFNPLFILFGFHFYHAVTKGKSRIFIIVKGDVIRQSSNMAFDNLKRINDSSYIVLRRD